MPDLSQPDLTPKQVAEELQTSPYNVRKMRMRGGGPPYYRITPRVIRYPREEFESWKQSRTVNATCEENPNMLSRITPGKVGSK